MLVRYAIVLALILASPMAMAEGPPLMGNQRDFPKKDQPKNESGSSRRAARLEDKIDEQKKELAEKKKELVKVARELARPAKEMPKPAKKAPPLGKGKLPPLRIEAESKEELLARQEELKSEITDLKDEIERNEEKLDRLEASAEQPKKSAICENCEAKKSAPNQGKSGWEGFAEVLKAATPLGLGGMNTWLGYQGVKAQSSDYNLYANSMMGQGLPIQPNSSNYGSTIGSATGANSMLMAFMNGGNAVGMNTGFGTSAGFGMNMGGYGGMNMAMPNMYGSSYGYGFPSYGMSNSSMGYGNSAYSSMGSAYMSPYAAYGTNAFGYNGMNYYNPYGSAYYGQYNASGLNSFYQNQLRQTQSGVYSAQQRTLLGQDAQVAQQSLSEAYSRYNYVMGQMGGTGTGYYTGTAIPSVSATASGTFNASAVPSFSASATRY